MQSHFTVSNSQKKVNKNYHRVCNGYKYQQDKSRFHLVPTENVKQHSTFYILNVLVDKSEYQCGNATNYLLLRKYNLGLSFPD